MFSTKCNPNCKICSSAEGKYKCPNCKILYCSVDCYQKHKETPCIKEEIKKVPTIRRKISKRKKELPIQKIITISQRQLSYLKKEEKLRTVLQDERLQEVINNILEIGVDDLKSNPDDTSLQEEIDLHKVDEIRRLMETAPEFADFAHLCLQSLGIRDSKGHCIL